MERIATLEKAVVMWALHQKQEAAIPAKSGLMIGLTQEIDRLETFG